MYQEFNHEDNKFLNGTNIFCPDSFIKDI